MMRTLIVTTVAAFATSALAQLCPPETLAVLPRGELLGGRVSIDIDGDRLAVYSQSAATMAADGSYNVELFDVSDPTAPALISTIQAQAFGREEVRLRGDTLWMFDGGYGWTIPLTGEPVIAPPPADGFWDTYFFLPGTPSASGQFIDYQFNDAGLLYVTNRGWLRVYDASEPIGLVLLSEVRYSQSSTSPTTIEGDYLYMETRASAPPGDPYSSEILIWDIADPLVAEIVGRTTLEGYEVRQGMQFDGDRLYLAGSTPEGGYGRVIIDVADKHAPSLLGVVDRASAYGFAIDDLVVEMGFGTQCLLGWSVYDITDPSAPRYRSAVDFAVPVTIRQFNTLTTDFVLLEEYSYGSDSTSLSLRFVRPPDCEFATLAYNVLVVDEVVVGPEDTEIQGVPLEDAVIFVGSETFVYARESMFPPGCEGRVGRLVFQGDHTVKSIDVSDGGELVAEGTLTLDQLDITRGSQLTAVGDLEAITFTTSDSSITLNGNASVGSLAADSTTIRLGGELTAGTLELTNESIIIETEPGDMP